MPRKANETKNKEVKEKAIDIKSIEIELNNYLEDRKVDIIKEINSKTDEQIEIKIAKRLKEEEKRIIRGKTAKIIWRDIIIILLLGVIGYFGYCLYDVDYFHIRTKVVLPNVKEPDKDNDSEIKEPNNQEPVEDNKPNSEYYIKNYSNLIDNLLINDEAVFDLFNNKTSINNISNDLILKIAYKNIDRLNITNNDNMITFHEDILLESAKKIFGDNIKIINTMFSYNNIKFMYYNETYLGLKESDVTVDLLYKIIDAKEENNILTFNIIATKLNTENNLLDKDGNIIIENYNNEDLLEYKDKLAEYTISFTKQDDNYIFYGIESISEN